MMRHFVDLRTPDHTRITEEVNLFKLTCQALDLVLAAKKRRVGVREAGRQLLSVLEEHLQQHVKVHGSRRILPKEPLVL